MNTDNANETSPGRAPEQVLSWIENYVRDNELTSGDSLPGEIEMATACSTSRSSVREALTALKAFGIIEQRRKGGIRLTRDPILLELRHYFAQRFDSTSRYKEASEFRAALERGFSSLIVKRIDTRTLQDLNNLLERVRNQPGQADIRDSEREFHTKILGACGNDLAELFAYLYAPIFDTFKPESDAVQFDDQYIQLWIDQHQELVDALQQRNEQQFVHLLHKHTQAYIR